jgi:clan AA aspartic protease
MGAIQVTVRVSNPTNSKRYWQGLFLVDTGSTDCLVPGRYLRKIGIKPKGKRTYELANGTEVIMEAGVAELEFMGDVVGATVIFGPDEAEPILGVTALESAGIEIDPKTQRLKRLPAVRLKLFSLKLQGGKINEA